MTIRPLFIALAVAAALTTAACTSPANDETATATVTNPAVTPTPTDADLDTEDTSTPVPDSASYTTVDDLKAALEAAGFDCKKFTSSTGACGNDYVLSVYPSAAERDVVVNAEQGKDDPTPMAIGANWIVTAGSNSDIADMVAISDKLGGFAAPQGS